MHALSPRVVVEFCKLCGWAYEAWLNHRELFDDNPRRDELMGSHAGPALARLCTVSQEYSLLQVVKLHDKAVVAGQVTLGIDYVVKYGAWAQPVLIRLQTLSGKLDDFARGLRSARNKLLSHNDLATVLSEARLGVFEKGKDVEYFKTLQEFVNVVHEQVVGGPWPFNDLAKNDVAGLLASVQSQETARRTSVRRMENPMVKQPEVPQGCSSRRAADGLPLTGSSVGSTRSEERMEFDPKCDGSRWVAYFDLLGMTEAIAEKRYMAVFEAYQRAIERLARESSDHERLRHSWFSDTFVLATVDDSGPSFAQLEQASRWFAYFLLDARIPLRGAIACGHLYADFASRVFVGQALIEAYVYGEAQDWVGYVLCPSAMSSMEQLGVPADRRLHYAVWTPQWKGKAPAQAPERLAACLLGSWITVNGCNPSRVRLEEMAAECKSDRIRAKYERAIQFIDDNPRQVVDDG